MLDILAIRILVIFTMLSLSLYSAEYGHFIVNDKKHKIKEFVINIECEPFENNQYNISIDLLSDIFTSDEIKLIEKQNYYSALKSAKKRCGEENFDKVSLCLFGKNGKRWAFNTDPVIESKSLMINYKNWQIGTVTGIDISDIKQEVRGRWCFLSGNIDFKDDKVIIKTSFELSFQMTEYPFVFKNGDQKCGAAYLIPIISNQSLKGRM